MAFWLPVVSLWRRELVRFARDRNRLFGAIGQPLVFWLLLGAGFEKSFAPLGISSGYLEYIIFEEYCCSEFCLFTAIFSTISVIDRSTGRIYAIGAGRTRIADRIGAGKSSRRGNPGLFGKPGIFGIFGIFRYPNQHRVSGYDPHFFSYTGHWSHSFGLCDSLAGFLYCGISRGDDFVFISPMGALWCIFPRRRRVALAGILDGNKSIDLWYDGLRQSLYLTTSDANTHLWFCVIISVAFAALTLSAAVWQVCRKENK